MHITRPPVLFMMTTLVVFTEDFHICLVLHLFRTHTAFQLYAERTFIPACR